MQGFHSHPLLAAHSSCPQYRSLLLSYKELPLSCYLLWFHICSRGVDEKPRVLCGVDRRMPLSQQLYHPTQYHKHCWVAPQHTVGKNKVTCFWWKFRFLPPQPPEHLTHLWSLLPQHCPDHCTLLSLLHAFCSYGTFYKEQFLCQHLTLLPKNTWINFDSSIIPVVLWRLEGLSYLTPLNVCRRHPFVHLAANPVSEMLLSWSPLPSHRQPWNTQEKWILAAEQLTEPHTYTASSYKKYSWLPIQNIHEICSE